MSKKNAPVSESKPSRNYTKKDRILDVLCRRSLNCFEAREYGDSCLHSTVAELRADGNLIHGQWEYVPSRWGADARVKRYRCLKRAR